MKQNTSRLPSYQCAIDFVEKPNVENSLRIFGSWVGRSLIVATGMAIAGKSFESAIKDGAIAATAIEVFVLGHALYEVKVINENNSSDALKSKP